MIQFENYVGNDLIKMDTAHYKNELGQSFTVTNFKYYISNIRLIESDGKSYISNEYFLINEDDNETKLIELKNIPEGEYIAISFMIGVDSLHNCSGAQSGALDPAGGMFWVWNTGYIFMKLEGKSPASQSPGQMFEYHIGGFKSPANCIRIVSLPFENKLIFSNNKAALTIKSDVLEILKTPVNIDFSDLSSVTDFHNATKVADNYSDMFSILSFKPTK
jgi:hypothetical protein